MICSTRQVAGFRDPASDTVRAGVESASLVDIAIQGNSAQYQTDSLVYNFETVSFLRHSFTKSQ